MKELVGTGVALITPFNKDYSVDVEGLKRVVKYSIDNGIDYLVVLGTTAESATLSKAEKQLVIDTVIDANASKLPLVLGIGGNDTAAVIEEIQSRDLRAFTAILSVSPYYNRPTQEGIYRHFAAIANISSITIIVYNVPARTGSNVLPETVLRLGKDFKNIIGVKEAAGDIVQAMHLLSDRPIGFMVISGDDMIALPMVLAGGEGVISVIGQGFPKKFSQMIRLGLDKKVDKAFTIQFKITPAIDAIFAEGNPAGIKAVFNKLGICGDTLRLPLVGVSDSLRSKIDTYVDRF
jgi:4-hydroxy-tetrahydrodipicolinate synthase